MLLRCESLEPPMSQLGHERRFDPFRNRSALLPKSRHLNGRRRACQFRTMHRSKDSANCTGPPSYLKSDYSFGGDQLGKGRPFSSQKYICTFGLARSQSIVTARPSSYGVLRRLGRRARSFVPSSSTGACHK
jgi:hypothetical protein